MKRFVCHSKNSWLHQITITWRICRMFACNRHHHHHRSLYLFLIDMLCLVILRMVGNSAHLELLLAIIGNRKYWLSGIAKKQTTEALWWLWFSVSPMFISWTESIIHTKSKHRLTTTTPEKYLYKKKLDLIRGAVSWLNQ